MQDQFQLQTQARAGKGEGRKAIQEIGQTREKEALEQNLNPTPFHIVLLLDPTTLLYTRGMLSDTKQSLL